MLFDAGVEIVLHAAGRGAYLISYFLERWLIELAPDERGVSLNDDVVLLAVFDDRFLLAQRVELRR